MTGIIHYAEARVTAERKLIADWLRWKAEGLVPAQRDCLLANTDIIEQNRYVVERSQ